MEEGRKQACTQFAVIERSPSMYIECVCKLPEQHVAGWDQFQPFGEPASRFTSAIERSGIWKKGR
jgi:hypothetical protein